MYVAHGAFVTVAFICPDLPNKPRLEPDGQPIQSNSVIDDLADGEDGLDVLGSAYCTSSRQGE